MNKSLLLSIIPYLFPIGVICEEDFLFSLLFTDSLGNSNEIYLGYDKDATDSVDTIYGENDVSSMALNPELDIRISQDTIGDLDESISFPSFQSKKQVLKNRCSENSAMVFRIDIHAKYWPLEVTWDPLKFNEECRAASGFTNTRKGALGDGWLFSTLGWQELNSTGRLQFNANSNVNPNWKGDKRVSYVFENDTVPVFWVWLLKTPPSSVEDIWRNKGLRSKSIFSFRKANLNITYFDLMGKRVEIRKNLEYQDHFSNMASSYYLVPDLFLPKKFLILK